MNGLEGWRLSPWVIGFTWTPIVLAGQPELPAFSGKAGNYHFSSSLYCNEQEGSEYCRISANLEKQNIWKLICLSFLFQSVYSWHFASPSPSNEPILSASSGVLQWRLKYSGLLTKLESCPQISLSGTTGAQLDLRADHTTGEDEEEGKLYYTWLCW